MLKIKPKRKLKDPRTKSVIKKQEDKLKKLKRAHSVRRGIVTNFNGSKKKYMNMGADCLRCPLYKYIPLDTEHSDTKKIMFCGYKPDIHDVMYDKLFQSDKKQVFDVLLDSIDETFDSVGRTNSIMCATDGDISQEDIKLAEQCCSTRLRNETELYDNVVTLGIEALKSLSDVEDDFTITKTHGQYYGDKILSTYALEYAAHENPNIVSFMTKDLLRLEVGPNRISEPEIVMLDSLGKVKDFVEYVLSIELDKIVIDLETSHVDRLHSRPDVWWDQTILCMGISIGPGKAYIIPENIVMSEDCLDALRSLLGKDNLVGANFIFDVLILRGVYYKFFGESFHINIYRDTFMMSYVLDENKGRHSLKEHASWFDDRGYDDVIDQYISKKHDSYAQVPTEELYKYLARDVDYTFMLDDIFCDRLLADDLYDWPYMNVLSRAQNSFSKMEYLGVATDIWKLKEAREEVEPLIKIEKKTLRDLVGNPDFNPGSPQQLSAILYDKLKLPMPKAGKGKTKTCEKALDELNKLLEHQQYEGSIAKEILNHVSKYRSYGKLLNSYINKIEYFMDEKHFSHHRFNLARTLTGRLSGGILMTLPSDAYGGPLIRGCFRAPETVGELKQEYQDIVEHYISSLNREVIPMKSITIKKDNPKKGEGQPKTVKVIERPGDFVMLDGDYSQAEVRTAGFLSQDEQIINVYALGKDIHDTIARIAFQIVEEFEVSKDQRRIAKAIVFGYLYGMVYTTLINKSMGADENGIERFITHDEAKEIFDSFEEYVKQFRDWRDLQYSIIKEFGWIQTPTGRKRRIPLVNYKNEYLVKNKSYNFPVQSLANDVALLALCEIIDFFEDKNLPVWPVIFLHDGIYLYCYNDEPLISYAVEQVGRIMEETADFVQSLPYEGRTDLKRVPFKADIDLRVYWA